MSSNNIPIIELVNTIIENKINNIATIELERILHTNIFHLYNLTYDEVLIVNPETKISREEYEQFEI